MCSYLCASDVIERMGVCGIHKWGLGQDVFHGVIQLSKEPPLLIPVATSEFAQTQLERISSLLRRPH